jgi:LysR family transcriptional regulator for metE and metH
MMFDLKHLLTIKRIKETGSLVEAADRMCVTQSALSHQLKDLETRLDVQLVLRKSRPLKLTSAGERLAKLADEVIPMMQHAERDIARLAGGETGRLHIAIECHSCFNWLMPSITSYREHWPEIELDLSTAFNFMPLPALLRGDLDLVLTSDPQNLAGITYEPMFSYEGKLGVAKNHDFAKKGYVLPADLKSETLITYPVEQNRLDVFTRFLDPAGEEPAAVRTAELTLMIVQLVASGRGVCALPNWALKEYVDQDYIATVKLGKLGLWSNLYFAMREESAQSVYIKEFIKLAREVCFATLDGVRAVHS